MIEHLLVGAVVGFILGTIFGRTVLSKAKDVVDKNNP